MPHIFIAVHVLLNRIVFPKKISPHNCLILSPNNEGQVIMRGMTSANGDRPGSNSPDPPLCEAHFC